MYKCSTIKIIFNSNMVSQKYNSFLVRMRFKFIKTKNKKPNIGKECAKLNNGKNISIVLFICNGNNYHKEQSINAMKLNKLGSKNGIIIGSKTIICSW